MASEYFLKIDGIDGESTDAKHIGEIELLGYSWSETQAGTQSSGGGGGAGKVSMRDFVFQMHASKASPKLMLACATGDHIKTAKLTIREVGGPQQEYMTITLSDVLVSSYQTEGTAQSGDSEPNESVSLNFAKLEFEYSPQKSDGTLDSPVKAGYDLKTNKKI